MKTVRVRIAVAVDGSGEWVAAGCAGYTDAEMLAYAEDSHSAYVIEQRNPRRCYFVEADLPVPEVATVEGSVTRAEESKP